MTVRPAKTQISLGIRPVWSESSLCAQWVDKGPSFLHADSKDSDQTGRMPRLIWVFAGRTLILLVLSFRGSFVSPFAKWKRSMSIKIHYISVEVYFKSEKLFLNNNGTRSLRSIVSIIFSEMDRYTILTVYLYYNAFTKSVSRFCCDLPKVPRQKSTFEKNKHFRLNL